MPSILDAYKPNATDATNGLKSIKTSKKPA